jgi:hypothetical protein
MCQLGGGGASTLQRHLAKVYVASDAPDISLWQMHTMCKLLWHGMFASCHSMHTLIHAVPDMLGCLALSIYHSYMATEKTTTGVDSALEEILGVPPSPQQPAVGHALWPGSWRPCPLQACQTSCMKGGQASQANTVAHSVIAAGTVGTAAAAGSGRGSLPYGIG